MTAVAKAALGRKEMTTAVGRKIDFGAVVQVRKIITAVEKGALGRK